jgi:hypothetical protein
LTALWPLSLAARSGSSSDARVSGCGEAQNLRPASPAKHNRPCRLAAIGPMVGFALCPRPKSRPCVMQHRATPPHIRSPFVTAAPGAPMHGATGRAIGTILTAAFLAPGVDAVPCPGLRQADQARPKLVISVISCHECRPLLSASADLRVIFIPSARRLPAPPRHAHSATAPRATCAPGRQSRCAAPACPVRPPFG